MHSFILSALFVAGLALVAAGAALVYLPAGLVVAGVELAGGVYLLEKAAVVAELRRARSQS